MCRSLIVCCRLFACSYGCCLSGVVVCSVLCALFVVCCLLVVACLLLVVRCLDVVFVVVRCDCWLFAVSCCLECVL